MRKILCLFAIAYMVMSCGKKSAESSYIPKDAIGVMYINLESLSKKTKDLDFKDLSLHKMIEDRAPQEIQDFMKEYMTAENMEATFRKEFILGFASIDRMSGLGGLIIPIKDGASFEKMIQPLIEKVPEMQLEKNVGKNDAFTVYSTDKVAIGWDEKTALIIGAKDYAGTELTDLTELATSKNIYATDYYKDFFDPSKDMGMHITSTPLATVMNSLATMFAGMDIDLENNNMTYYGNFEDDHVYTNSKLELNKDFESLVGYKSWISTGYDSDLLSAIPENPSFLFKISIDPAALYAHVESLQDNKVLPANARAELKKGLREMNRKMKREIDMTGEDLANIFEGSMLVSVMEGQTIKDTVYNFSYYGDEPEYEIVDKKQPFIYSAIAIRDKAKFDVLMSTMLEKDAPMKTKGNSYYQLSKELFAVVKDEFLFLSNDVAKADELYEKGELTANLSSFEHKSNLSNSAYMYLNSGATDVYSDYLLGMTSLNPYSRAIGSFKSDSETIAAKLYSEYFGDTHYIMNVDGSETFTYTKGEGNSLMRILMYSDAMLKQYSETENQYTK